MSSIFSETLLDILDVLESSQKCFQQTYSFFMLCIFLCIIEKSSVLPETSYWSSQMHLNHVRNGFSRHTRFSSYKQFCPFQKSHQSSQKRYQSQKRLIPLRNVISHPKNALFSQETIAITLETFSSSLTTFTDAFGNERRNLRLRSSFPDSLLVCVLQPSGGNPSPSGPHFTAVGHVRTKRRLLR